MNSKVTFLILLSLAFCWLGANNTEANSKLTTSDSEYSSLTIPELTALAETANSDAQYYLGLHYYNQGKGHSYLDSKDYSCNRKLSDPACADSLCIHELIKDSGQSDDKCLRDALKWFKMAAELGNIEAQYYLGLCYGRGEGVSHDLTEAFRWYLAAAEHGHALSQYLVGCFYESGIKVEKNCAEAAKWFHLSAEQGYNNAQHRLGLCYSKGIGIEKDYAKAYFWLLLAAANGCEYASKDGDKVSSNLTKQQKLDVVDRVTKWTGNHRR